MNQKQRWRIHALIITLPFAFPLLAGLYWLWLNQMLTWWVFASTVPALGWWLMFRTIKKSHPDPEWLDISQSIIWTRQNREAWKKVEAISAAQRDADPDLGSGEFYLQTLTQVMRSVAEAYYPGQKQAIREIKIPYLLKVIEMLAQELRINLTENVPGSHMFSLNDIAKGHKFANQASELYRLFRIVSAGIDPVSAIIRELKITTTVNLLADSSGEIKRWLIDAYIKKIAYYAIELYSGNLALDDSAFDQPSRQAQRDMDAIKLREESYNAEPFRVLVIGQANAGKASLINAIAGNRQAVVDVTPNPRHHQAYLLDGDDFSSAIIVNSLRYQDNQSAKALQAIPRQAAESDVLILVLSATNAGYQIDKTVLDSIKQLPNAPRLMIALTHIDKLRPMREWNPPYDVIKPGSAKAEAIKNAMTIIAEQLHIGFDQIIPVSMREGMNYNCRERLVPVLLQQLELADRKRYVRCAQAHERDSHWSRLWRQSLNAGSLASKTGIDLLARQYRWFRD